MHRLFYWNKTCQLKTRIVVLKPEEKCPEIIMTAKGKIIKYFVISL